MRILDAVLGDNNYPDLFHKMLAISGTGFGTYDFINNEHEVSENLQNWLSSKEQEIIRHKGVFALLSPEVAEKINQQIKNALRQKHESLEFTEQYVTDKKGKCVFNIKLEITYSPDNVPLRLLGIIHDITKQVAEEKIVTKQKKGANQDPKNLASQIANMGHELRNAIGGVIGMTDILLEESHSDKTNEKLNIIAQSAQNMMKIVNRTIDEFKRTENESKSKQLQISPLQFLANATQSWQKHAEEKGNVISHSCSENLPDQIELDEVILKQCLNGLISNAVKFTLNGRISVRMKTINSSNNTDYYALIVQDTGIGMTLVEQDKIRARSKRKREVNQYAIEGESLGLELIQTLVESMNGRFIVKSNQHAGTAIGLVFPLTPVVEKPLEAVPEKCVDLPTPLVEDQKIEKQPAILVVDDISTNRTILEYMLCDDYSNLVFAENGQKAIDVLNEQSISLVLMDVHMPVLNGVQAASTIRASQSAYKNVPIFAVTADEEYYKRSSLKSSDFNGVIAKPVSKQALLEKIKQALSTPSLRVSSATERVPHQNLQQLIVS